LLRPWLLLVYLATAAAITLWPASVDPGLRDALHSAGVGRSYGIVQVAANVLFFVPAGYLGVRALGTHHWPIVLALALAGSLAVEFVQSVALEGRIGDARDIAANTLGAVFGIMLARIVARQRRRRHPVT